MLWLGDWQFHRAMEGNGLSWAYTFEWPLFAGFGVVFWARTIRDEFRLRRGGVTEADLVAAAMAQSMATLPKGAILPAGVLPEGVGVRQIERPDDDEDDAELASYNAYLAKLNAEVKGHNKWLRHCGLSRRPATRSRQEGHRRCTRPLLRYRVMAYITGVLIIVVCFVGIPLQVAAHNTFIANDIGTVHGFLYIVYVDRSRTCSRRS